MSEKTINSTLEARGSVYGDYGTGVKSRAEIMRVLAEDYARNNGDVEMPEVAKGMLWDIVNKLCRLSVTPYHVDSWHDIQGYARLSETIARGKNT